MNIFAKNENEGDGKKTKIIDKNEKNVWLPSRAPFYGGESWLFSRIQKDRK